MTIKINLDRASFHLNFAQSLASTLVNDVFIKRAKHIALIQLKNAWCWGQHVAEGCLQIPFHQRFMIIAVITTITSIFFLIHQYLYNNA